LVANLKPGVTTSGMSFDVSVPGVTTFGMSFDVSVLLKKQKHSTRMHF